jgi:hypothetical protein
MIDSREAVQCGTFSLCSLAPRDGRGLVNVASVGGISGCGGSRSDIGLPRFIGFTVTILATE